MVVAEIAGGCTRFFLFPSPLPSPSSALALCFGVFSLSRVVLVSDCVCMKATVVWVTTRLFYPCCVR